MNQYTGGGIELPGDAKSVGYKKINRFEFAQVFHSEKNNFTGTEQEFVNAGLAYKYLQVDAYKRIVIT